MLEIILNILLIIAALCWIGICGVIFVAIRSFNRDQQRQRENDAVALGIAGKAARSQEQQRENDALRGAGR